MKRWMVIVAVLSASVGLWALPPTALPLPEATTLPEQDRLAELEREIRREHGLLRILRWTDSLSALVVASATDASTTDGLLLSRPRADRIDAEAVQAWEEMQRGVVAGLEPRDPRMVVGLFWQRVDHGMIPGLPIAGIGRDMTYVGQRAGTPYCVRALAYSTRSSNETLSGVFDDLGACRLYATYGMPGARIQGWLEASALGFARVSVPTFAADFSRVQPVVPVERRIFGRERPTFADQNVVVQACLAGRAKACEWALTDPGVIGPSGDEVYLIANSPAGSVGGQRSSPPFGYLDDGLLYELEARFGSEAFGRFWTSAESVPRAFEAAFGVPLGEWVMDWAEGYVGLYRAGPSLSWRVLLLTFLTVAVFAGGATAVATRRAV